MNKVTVLEVMMVAMVVTVATALLYTPYLAALTAAQDAWVSVILAGILSIIPAWATGSLMDRFPNQSITEMLVRLLGKPLGKIVGFAYVALFLFYAALAVWRLEVFVARFLLPDTPVLAIRVLFMLVVGYAAIKGGASLTRTSSYIVPAGFVVMILAFILPLKRMEFSYLFPLFEQGVVSMIKAAIMLTGWLCQIPLIVMQYHRYVQKKSLKGTGPRAVVVVILSALAIELGILGTLAAFGPRQTASMYYPVMELARITSLGNFLEHMEVTLVTEWIAGIFVAATFYTQAFATCLTDVLNVQGKVGKTIIMAVGILVLLCWPFVFHLSFLTLIVAIRDYGAISASIMGGILPLLLWARAAMMPELWEEAQAMHAQEQGTTEIGSQRPGARKDG